MASERLLEAVHDVLADQGVEALSIRAVATAAGVSPAQVQYHYRTRAALVSAAYEHAWLAFRADLAAAAPSTVAEFVDQWLPLDERRERRARVWLAYAAIAVGDDELRPLAAAHDEELRRWYVAQGLSKETAAQLFALVDGVTVQCLTLPPGERRPLVDRTVHAFVRAAGADRPLVPAPSAD